MWCYVFPPPPHFLIIPLQRPFSSSTRSEFRPHKLLSRETSALYELNHHIEEKLTAVDLSGNVTIFIPRYNLFITASSRRHVILLSLFIDFLNCFRCLLCLNCFNRYLKEGIYAENVYFWKPNIKEKLEIKSQSYLTSSVNRRFQKGQTGRIFSHFCKEKERK